MTTQVNRLLLIGGYPKGYSKPFDERTLSGKRLRAILRRNNLNPIIIDLWKNELQEKKGEIPISTYWTVEDYIRMGYRVIALGKWVFKCLNNHFYEVEYLPHPASRRKIDLEKLERGLISN